LVFILSTFWYIHTVSNFISLIDLPYFITKIRLPETLLCSYPGCPMIAEVDFDRTVKEEPVHTVDSAHTLVHVHEAVLLARIEVDPVGHMEVDLEVDRTGVVLGSLVVVRIEVDSRADQKEAADDFLAADHIAVAFEVVRSSLDSGVVRIEDVRLLEDCWYEAVHSVVDLLGVDRMAEWQGTARMALGSQEVVHMEVEVDHKEADLPAVDRSVVVVVHIEAGLQESARTAADLSGEVHTEAAIVVDHIVPEERDQQNTQPA
jgi:hypothetical protein